MPDYITDEKGVYWYYHDQSKRWLYFNGKQWVPGTPSQTVLAKAPSKTAVPAKPVASPTPGKPAAVKKKGKGFPLIPLVVVLLLGVGAYLMFSGGLSIPGLGGGGFCSCAPENVDHFFITECSELDTADVGDPELLTKANAKVTAAYSASYTSNFTGEEFDFFIFSVSGNMDDYKEQLRESYSSFVQDELKSGGIEADYLEGFDRNPSFIGFKDNKAFGVDTKKTRIPDNTEFIKSLEGLISCA